MNIAVCITQGSIAYNGLLSSDKVFYVSSQPNSDLQLPIEELSFSINWQGNGALVKVTSGKKTTRLLVEENTPTVIDERLDITVLVSETDNSEITLPLPTTCEALM